MGNRWKVEVSRTILNIFRPYNGIDIVKLPFLEELHEKAFVVPYAVVCLSIELILIKRVLRLNMILLYQLH